MMVFFYTSAVTYVYPVNCAFQGGGGCCTSLFRTHGKRCRSVEARRVRYFADVREAAEK